MYTLIYYIYIYIYIYISQYLTTTHLNKQTTTINKSHLILLLLVAATEDVDPTLSVQNDFTQVEVIGFPMLLSKLPPP